MIDVAKPLKKFGPASDFLIAIDSDGCVFDTMGIKQRECFCPMMIGYFGLQGVAEAARQCKEFADLFSKTRGANRHKTIARILTELLPSHPGVKERNFEVPRFDHYIKWVENHQSLLSNEGLERAILEADSDNAREQLKTALTWSKRVDDLVSELVRNIPPFPHFKQSIAKASRRADIIVCSATPNVALQREWQEHGIAHYPSVIAGQEMGTKAQHLKYITEGKYRCDRVLMIGDAPGDMLAAKSVRALFYPINPGNESQSWKRFHDEVLEKFIDGRYAGECEQNIIAEFEDYLPDNPPWSASEDLKL